MIYLGPYAIDGVPDALAELRSRGVHLGYVTNNAARTPATVAEHLVELGIDAAEADVVNSTMATLRMLGDDLPTTAPGLAVGTDALREQLTGAGFTLVDSLDAEPAAVVRIPPRHRLAEARGGARRSAGRGLVRDQPGP